MKKSCLLLVLVLLLGCVGSAFAADDNGFVFLTTEQLPADTTIPSVPSYSFTKGDELVLKGDKVTDSEYTDISIEYVLDGEWYWAPMNYDSSTKSWVAEGVSQEDLARINPKNVSLYFGTGIGYLEVKDHDFKYYYNQDNFEVSENKRQYWYGGDAWPAKYDRAGNLMQYTVDVYENDAAGNQLERVTYSAGGSVLGAQVYGADGKDYVYQNGSWKTYKIDAEGYPIYSELVSSKAPAGFDVKTLKDHKLTVIQPKRQWFENNTVGVRGLFLRDLYPDLTSRWYNVAPVDLTKQGRQTFDLVASNLYMIGHAYVDVKDDSVTVSYDYFRSDIAQPLSETAALFTSIDQLTTEYLENPTGNITVGKPVSISQDLGGSDTALLFFCNRLTYSQPYTDRGAMLSRFWPNHPRYANDKANMKALLEKIK